MKKRTLYVSDMDGTLLNSNSVLSAKTISKLNGLIEKGALFTVATARTPATVVDLMKDVHARLPFIVMAGCAQWSPQLNTYQSARIISESNVQKLLPVFARHGNNPFIYTKKGNSIEVFHVPQLTADEAEFIAPRITTPLKTLTKVDSLKAAGMNEGTMLIFSMGRFSTLRAIADEIDRLAIPCTYNCYHDIFNDDMGIIDLYLEGTTKALAIRQLANEIGAERTVVFGDNLNDIPMMDAANWSVAVDNAFGEVKAHANEVIGCNNDDAVVEWIERDFSAIME